MRRVTKLSAVAVAIAVAGGGTMAAYAQWTVPSKPIGFKVESVDMPRGVRPSVARNGTDAVVSWSPQEIDPGTPMQTYIVKRRNADDDSLAVAFPPTAAVTVTEKNVAAGKWYWTVTPAFALWTGAESKASEKLKFQAPADAVAANTLVSAPATAVTGAAKAAAQTTSVVQAPEETVKPVEPPAAATPTPITSEPTTPAPAESTTSADPGTPAGTDTTGN